MSEILKCNRCGAALPPDGLCPRCLIALNLATQTEIVEQASSLSSKGQAGRPSHTPPLPVDEVAKLFPQLEILECLGRGGMGAVYKARQPRLNRVVALKILSPEKQGEPKFAERFEREAQALAKLHHPNIVTVYDFGEANGNFYLLMEFVDGLTLRQLFQARKFSPAEALGIVPKICEALQYAHEQGVVHRDIKPENILLDKNGRVKIADFGIAKILGGDGRENLTAEQAIGTPHYMAPEQLEKPQTVDHRADIYSLGVVFYEMLTGELPLGKFSAPSKKVQIDVRLDEIVLRALEKEPERRYQHASEVKTEVETISSSKLHLKTGLHVKRSTLSLILGAGIVCVLLVAALLIFHGKSTRTLTIRAFIDGSDVIKVSGNKLWIEYDTGVLPGKTIYINGQAWTPTWTNNVSSEFDAVNPAFQPHDPQTIHITKRAGRGIVSIEQFPTTGNDQTLAVRINDDDFDGADWYKIVISWDGRPISSTSSVAAQIQKTTGSDSTSQSAMPAVQVWLKFMDNGDYGKSWETAADSFHGAVTKNEWVAKSEEVRQPLGKLISRTLTSSRQTGTLPGMPDGSYFIAKFDTSFAAQESVVETITLSLGNDGQWKTIGYLIQPGDDSKNSANPGADEKAAVSAAQTWLASIDDGQYAESWTSAGNFFQASITQDKWVSALQSVRKPLGDLVSRKLKSAQATTRLPGAPDGQYVVMQFETTFANKKSAVETVTFMLEKNGQWKSTGYYIK